MPRLSAEEVFDESECIVMSEWEGAISWPAGKLRGDEVLREPPSTCRMGSRDETEAVEPKRAMLAGRED